MALRCAAWLCPGRFFHAVTSKRTRRMTGRRRSEWGFAAGANRSKSKADFVFKNGDIWPGRNVGETERIVQWETQGVDREVPKGWLKEGKAWR